MQVCLQVAPLVLAALLLGCTSGIDVAAEEAAFTRGNRLAEAHRERAPDYDSGAVPRAHAEAFLASGKGCKAPIPDHQLVVSLGESGEVLEAFVSLATRGTRCIASRMLGRVLPTPPFSPFYLWMRWEPASS